MRFYFLPAIGILIPFLLNAQVSSVKITVHVPEPAENKHVYLAGSFNNWKAKDSLYKMKREDAATYTIVLPAFKNAKYQYKYTLGNWNEAEVAANDSTIPDRSFVSTKKKMKITDTVAKWATPKPVAQNTNPQLMKINAMKDSVMKDLQPKLGEMLALLKAFTVNLLQEKPDTAAEQKIVEEVNNHLKDIHKKLNDLFHQVFASLTPQQKQKILTALNNSAADNDFFNVLGAAFNDVMK